MIVPVYDQPQVELKPLAGIRAPMGAQPNALVEAGKVVEELGEKLGDFAAQEKHRAQVEKRAYDKAEASRLIATTKEEFDSLIQTNAIDVADPDEFFEKTSADLKDRYQSTIEAAKNPQVKALVEADLSSALIRANRSTQANKFGKQKDQAKASVDESLQTYARIAVNAQTEEERDDAVAGFGTLLGFMKGSNFLSADAAGDIERRFRNDVREGRKALFSTGLKDRLVNLVNDATTGKARPEELFTQGNGMIDAFRDMEPAEIEKTKAWFKDTFWTGAIEGRIDRDPVRTDREIKSGLFNSLIDPQSLRFLSGKSEAELERRRRQAEAYQKENLRLIGKEVDDFKAAVTSGFPWSGNVAQLYARVRGTEHEKEFVESANNARELNVFGQMSPLQQEDYLRARAQTPKSGGEAKLYRVLESAHVSTKTALKNDPITFAIRQRVIPSLSQFDVNNPDSMKDRSLAAGIVEQRYGVPVSPLSDDEADRLRTMIEKSPADGKAAILQKLRAGLDDRHIKSVAAQFAKKDAKVLAFATGLSVEAPAVSSRILQGLDVLKDNPKAAPAGAALNSALDRINSTLGEAYRHNPEHLAAVKEAALAIYAQKSWQARALSGTLDTTRLDESIKEASGGVLSISRGFLQGSYRIQPPRYGMTEAGFRTALDKADYSKAQGLNKAEILKHGIFESVGDGKYLVRVGPGYVQSDRGPFILELDRAQY